MIYEWQCMHALQMYGQMVIGWVTDQTESNRPRMLLGEKCNKQDMGTDNCDGDDDNDGDDVGTTTIVTIAIKRQSR